MIAKTIKLGQIGYGYWGERLYRSFSAHSGFEITKVAARDSLKVRNGLDRKITSARDIYEDKDIQAVIVATPVETHFEISRDVLKSGKHLFCEKLFTSTAKESEELQRTSEQAHLKMMIDYTFTFSLGIRKMIEIARSGQIGELNSAKFEMCQFGNFRPEGVYSIIGCHMLSVLNMLHPLHEYEFTRHDTIVRGCVPESGWISFTHRRTPFNGLIYLCLNDPEKTRKITLFGSRGILDYNMYSSPAVKHVCFDPESENREILNTADYSNEKSENNNLAFAADAFYSMITCDGPSNIDCAIQVARALERISAAEST